MFNTEIIHFLQQFDNSILYWFMVLISALGTTPIILAIVLGIAFGVDFKKGLVLINIIAWTALATNVAKEQIDFPRPPDVDPTIKVDYYEVNPTDLSKVQPLSFFEVFSPELLNQTRSDEWNHYGFPSGHTSIQVALWLGLFFLFRKRWIAFLGITAVILTMISRLYLGHHFLGDVFGGLFLGLIISGMLLLLVSKSKYLNQLSHHFYSLSILWLPAILIPFTPFVPVWILASMVGINTASALIILQKNFPVFHVIPWKRVASAVLSCVIIFIVSYVNRIQVYSSNQFLELLIESTLFFALLIGSITLSNRLNLIRFRF